jgi:Protein of unknown function (DUF3179)
MSNRLWQQLRQMSEVDALRVYLYVKPIGSTEQENSASTPLFSWVTAILLFLLLAMNAFAEDPFQNLLSNDAAVRQQAAKDILDNPQKSSIPLVTEACFYFTLLRDSARVEEMSAILRKLTGHSEGRKYFDWVRWIGAHEDVRPLPKYVDLKVRVLSRVDPAFGVFFKDPESFRIRMEEVVWGGVKKDGIPALVNPPAITGKAAEYLTDKDRVLGITIRGESRAYPLRIMDWHEMANDTLGGVRIVIPYCTLCGSAILYKAGEYTFGSSGLLYRSNKLMYDRETNSLWSALAGEPIAGPLANKSLKLEMLPIVVTTWGEWRRRHPDTTVLSLATGHDRDYNVEPYKEYFASEKNMFPVPFELNKLKLKDKVFALRIGEIKKAYPMDTIARKRILTDKVEGKQIAIISDDSGWSARAYYCEGDKRPDKSWIAEEEALNSPDGKWKCKRVAGHIAYWFGWYAQFPNTLLYE